MAVVPVFMPYVLLARVQRDTNPVYVGPLKNVPTVVTEQEQDLGF